MMGARLTADRLDSSTEDIRLISAVEMRLVNGATAIIAMPLKISCKPGTHSRKGIAGVFTEFRWTQFLQLSIMCLVKAL